MADVCAMFFSVIFFAIPAFLFLMGFLSSFIKIVRQYEEGVLFAFGKFSKMMKPGLNIILPIYNRAVIVDMRIATVDIPTQEVITKDNVPVKLNAVIFYKVSDPKKAILNVEDYMYAVAKYGQTALRNVAGDAELDDLLSERKEIAEKLRLIVDEATDPWGISVVALELQDIELPETMKRTMAKQAEAEREKRATIIKAEGEVLASKNLQAAAKILHGVKGALHLRTLHSLNDMSSDQSNTINFVLPIEILRAFEEVE